MPFFIHWPAKIEGGKHYDGLSSSLDIFATALAAAGSETGDHASLDGVDLLPFLQGERAGEQPHEQLYWRKHQMAALRHGKYKMIRVEELGYRIYDIEKNLGETMDLTPSEPGLFEALNRKLERWEEGLIEPRWTEGDTWDTITWMIHEDYFNNRDVRVKNPQQLIKLKQSEK